MPIDLGISLEMSSRHSLGVDARDGGGYSLASLACESTPTVDTSGAPCAVFTYTPGGNPEREERFDPLGRPTLRREWENGQPKTERHWEYSEFGLQRQYLVNFADGGAYAVETSIYTDGGLLERVVEPGGYSIEYRYGDAGELTQVLWGVNDAGVVYTINDYLYDGGRVAEIIGTYVGRFDTWPASDTTLTYHLDGGLRSAQRHTTGFSGGSSSSYDEWNDEGTLVRSDRASSDPDGFGETTSWGGQVIDGEMRTEGWSRFPNDPHGYGSKWTIGSAASEFDPRHLALRRTTVERQQWEYHVGTYHESGESWAYSTSRTLYACEAPERLVYENDVENDGVVDVETAWQHDVLRRSVIERSHDLRADAGTAAGTRVTVRRYRCPSTTTTP